MKRIYGKLFVTVATLLVAILLIVGVSYSWVVLSTSPSATGMTVAIGGGQTILVAADISEIVQDDDGNKIMTIHYPGKFSDTLELENYDIQGLKPVSTADGLHWVLPKYDDYTGALLDLSDFEVDDTLKYAAQGGEEGRYAYVDFWVVARGKDYNLRVSTDKNTHSGSYLLELPEVVADTDGSLTLSMDQSVVAASARIGFLTNTYETTSQTVECYQNSDEANETYTTLLGVYQEPGESAAENPNVSFTIYEPNGTLHAGDNDGCYLVTKPLAVSGEGITATGIDPDRIAVQTTSQWNEIIEQQFQASVIGKNYTNARRAQTYFYDTFLGGQVRNLLSTGTFFENTAQLYDKAGEDGVVTSEDVEALSTAGASENGVIVHLTKNVPQKIRMFIWLEGTDSDCVVSDSGYIDASRIVLSIELAGSEK